MGQVTPNIGIYIPAAGETNYDAAFAAGMINIDQHDHSGGPNKGVPISGSGIADGSITFNKLNANVADAATGIGVPGSLGANQLTMLGLLKNIFQIATTSGFITKDGSLAHARTLQGTTNQIAITNPAGVAGDPVFSLSPIITNNTQPAFLASAAAQPDVTGDGTAYTVIFNAVDTRNFQQGTGFDGTSTFTVPAGAGGVYSIDVDITLGDLGVANTLGFADVLINGTINYRGLNCNLGAIRNAGNGVQFPFSQIALLAPGDTVTVVLTVSGGAKIVDVLTSSSFSMCKIW